MATRSIALVIGGIVIGVLLAGLTASAVTGVGPAGAWMGGGMHGGMHGRGMMGDGCHMCGGSTAGTTGSGTLVIMDGSQFLPTTLRVRVGDTVTWRNDDSVAHTVTSDSGDELDSPLLSPGESWQHTFTQPGTYDYHCVPHPGMTGRIVVE